CATVTLPDGSTRTRAYWLARRDVLDCAGDLAVERKEIIASALADFGLEAWKPDDPLPVTVALPQPGDGEHVRAGPSGDFCVGLPTGQATGLPAHVDARFFAKINRGGVIFDNRYNDLLLEVATELFADLLTHLRGSSNLAFRRAATLALHRPPSQPGE